jgi:hypothetical protein
MTATTDRTLADLAARLLERVEDPRAGNGTGTTAVRAISSALMKCTGLTSSPTRSIPESSDS